MRKKEKELYKNSPEALAFIEANPELFSDNVDQVGFRLPTPKDTDWMNNIQVLWGKKSREVMLDVSAGLSNEEIQKKYNFRSLSTVEDYIAKIKKQIKVSVAKRKKNNNRNKKVISDLTEIISSKSFSFNGEEKIVYLVKVSSDYHLKLDNFSPDAAEALYLRGEVLEEQMPARVRRYWNYFKENSPEIDYLFNQRDLNQFLSSYRWVDENGVSFKVEVDIQISITEEQDFSDIN